MASTTRAARHELLKHWLIDRPDHLGIQTVVLQCVQNLGSSLTPAELHTAATNHTAEVQCCENDPDSLIGDSCEDISGHAQAGRFA